MKKTVATRISLTEYYILKYHANKLHIPISALIRREITHKRLPSATGHRSEYNHFALQLSQLNSAIAHINSTLQSEQQKAIAYIYAKATKISHNKIPQNLDYAKASLTDDHSKQLEQFLKIAQTQIVPQLTKITNSLIKIEHSFSEKTRNN